MMKHFSRRNFLRGLGISTAALPFINGLPSIQANVANDPKKRLIIMFSPNGTLPGDFWPDGRRRGGGGADVSRGAADLSERREVVVPWRARARHVQWRIKRIGVS